MLLQISMNPNIKFTAAVIEIIIMYVIFIYLIIKTYTKFKVDDTQKNWHKHKNNPALLPFAGLFNKSFSSHFTGFIGSKVKVIFKPILDIFYYILGIFNRIFKYFTDSINKIRYLTKPIRMFFKRIALMFYKKLSKFTIAITYTVHKMRNALRRSVSGFNMMFHTLQHIQFAFLSIWNSPLVPLTEKFLPIADFIYKAFKELGFCFSGNTVIQTINGNIKIKDLKPGIKLDNDNCVISCQQFINNSEMYLYNNILVSGSHLVKENNKWIRVSDSNLSKLINLKEKYIYCLTTSKGIIKINDTVFKDFSESDNFKLNHHINNEILKKLNNTNNILNYNKIEYIEHGIDGDLTLDNIPIKNINIGDRINNSIVIGKILIDSSKIDTYIYKNKYVLSGNVKVNEKGLWLKIKDSIYSERYTNYTKPFLYHLITSNERLYVNNCLEICDYLEVHDKNVNDKIDKIVSEYYNTR